MGAHAEQSIYRFRGASSFNITRFGNADFAGATGKVGGVRAGAALSSA